MGCKKLQDCEKIWALLGHRHAQRDKMVRTRSQSTVRDGRTPHTHTHNTAQYPSLVHERVGAKRRGQALERLARSPFRCSNGRVPIGD